MPIGYTPTAKGNISLTFPYIADQYRSLGEENFPNPIGRPISVQHGGDAHGWGADANRMAMGKVQATRSIQRIFDRTPRFRIQPSGNTAQMPLFVNKDESMEALRKWTGGVLSGSGTAGALTTPAGERYKRRMLDARAEQFRNQLQGFDIPLPPEISHEAQLSRKQAMMTQSDLELSTIIDQFLSGNNDKLKLGEQDLKAWLFKFYEMLPFYDRNDVQKLVDVDRALNTIWNTELAKGNKFSSLAQQYREVLDAYMSVVNLQLPQRIQAVKSILRSVGLARLQKSVIQATEQEIANEGDEPQDAERAVFDNNEEELEGRADDEQVVQVPEMEQRNLPLYRSQAEITAEAKRRQQNYRTPLERAIYDIAIEWSPYTNYTPRAGTRYTAIRKTLVQRIRQVMRGNPELNAVEAEEEGENLFDRALPLGTGSGRRRHRRGGFDGIFGKVMTHHTRL